VLSVRWTTETTINLRHAGKGNKQKQVKMEAKWKPPDPEVIKVNVDVGSNLKGSGGSTGVVLSDHTGRLLRAQALWYEDVASTLVMETEAGRDSVRLAFRQRMILETDSLELVKIWNDLSIGRSTISSVCQEIRELSGFFTSFELVHVKRSASEGAHLCAHKASPERSRCVCG
jgi:hypothetical protein